MSEKQDTNSIRFSQVLSGALAAITAAVLGSTMGVAGTVIGAGLASMVTTVGGALYLRSIQRTKQGVQSVRNLVVARAGGTSVTLLEERPETAAEAEARAATEAKTDEPESAEAETESTEATEQTTTELGSTEQTTTEVGPVEEGEEQRRGLRWPALIAASVLAFLVGMLVVTGVELIRGQTMSGDEGTSVGGIVRTQQDGGQDRDQAPPATRESTTTPTEPSTVTVTENPPTSENEEPVAPSTEPTEPETTAPDTTTGGEPTGTVTVPPNGQTG